MKLRIPSTVAGNALLFLSTGAIAAQGSSTNNQVAPAPKPTTAVQALLDDAAKASEKAEVIADLQKAFDLAVQLKDGPGQGDALDLLGKVQLILRKYKEAQAWFEKELVVRRQFGDRGGEASALSNIGLSYYDLGECQHALECYDRAMPIVKELKNRKDEATLLNNYGLAHSGLGKDQLAIEFFEKALPIERELGLRSTEGTTLTNLGNAYGRAGQVQKELDTLGKALTIWAELKDYADGGSVLSSIGSIYHNLRQEKTAIEFLEQALTVEVALENKKEQATVLNWLGLAYAGLGENQLAVKNFEKALPILQELGDETGRAVVLAGAGMACIGLGQNQRALQYFQEALTIAKGFKERLSEANLTGDIGLAYSGLGQNQLALDYFSKALPVAKALGNRLSEATIISNEGLAYNALGQNKQALENFESALNIERELRDRRTEGTTLNNIGMVYNALGQNQRALETFEKALIAERETFDRHMEATTLNNIGLVNGELGENNVGLEYFQQVLPIVREMGDRRTEASMLNNIGMCYFNLLQYKTALDNFEKAEPIEKEVGDRRMEATTLSNIGLVYSSSGQFDTALKYYKEALAIEKEVGDRRMQGTTLGNIGGTYNGPKQAKLALSNYQNALLILKEVGDRSGEAITLYNMGLAFDDLGNLNRSIAFGKEAVNVTQSLRAEIKGLDKGLQSTFRDSVTPRYRQLADWLAAAGRLSEAEQVLDLLKDQEFNGFLKQRGATKSELVDLTPRESKWLKTYDELGGDLAAIGAERDELLKIAEADLTPEQKKRLAELEAKASRAAAAFSVFLAQSDDAFKAAGADKDRLEDVKQSRGLQKTLRALPGHPAAIYTLETSDGVRVIVSVPGFTAPRQAKSKVKAADLNKKILAFRQAVTNPILDPRPLGAELYDLLVRPIEKDLVAGKVHTLMWSLDGTLRYIPIWALYDRTTKQYLVEKYPSSLFTPRTVDGLLAEPHLWKGAEFGVTNGGTVAGVKFAALPGVAKELAGVHKSLNGPTPLVDSAFTYAAFTHALNAQPTVVHVATHFRFKPGDDVNSFLLLGKGESLSVEKFNSLPDDALSSVDLLVLSACETEMGNNADGSEFEGFARLAQQKGAGAVLATLWQVADESTSILMAEFYRLRKAHPEWTKLESLRQAQLEMLSGKLGGGSGGSRAGSEKVSAAQGPKWPKGMPSYSHPYYWAPFVLTGNWR